MKVARSRITAQGQVSVPVAVRQRLGLAPGSTLEWDEQGDAVVVRRAGRYSSEQIRCALFPDRPAPRRPVTDFDAGIRKLMRRRHARG